MVDIPNWKVIFYVCNSHFDKFKGEVLIAINISPKLLFLNWLQLSIADKFLNKEIHVTHGHTIIAWIN